MKRSCLCLLCLCLLVSACFVSCGDRLVTAYVYVDTIGEDYITGTIEGKGNVKILCDPGENVELFDTLKIKYRASDLVQESGTYTAITGNPAEYEWVLNKVESIRQSKPGLGEPLIG